MSNNVDINYQCMFNLYNILYLVILVLEKEEQADLTYSSYKTFNRAIAKCPSIFMIEINVSIVHAFKSQGVENS